MKKFIFPLLLFFVLAASAQNTDTLTTIYGVNKDYANKILNLNAFNNLITQTSYIIATDTVDSTGHFAFKLKLPETQLLNINLGIFNAIVYAEPHKTYEVALPPYQEKTKADILNPFFKPVEIYLGIKNRDSAEINFLIADFNDKYHRFVDQNYYAILKNPRKTNIDSLINSLEDDYKETNNSFFTNYRTYKYAWLRFISTMKNSRLIIREYFNDKPILYNNTAYMDLFNQIFTKYLSYYSQKKEGERLYSDIALAKSPTYIKQTFSNNLALLNDTLQELVLLRGLHDEFYGKDFPVKSLEITLDSIADFSKINYHKELAKDIKTKVLQAKKGTKAPKFNLKDQNGTLRTNINYLSNYVYLNFISIESYACQSELKLLKKIEEKHRNDFKVITIATDKNFEEVKEYFKANNYNWLLLDGSNSKDLIKKYNVKVFPSYFLIDTDGTLNMSPAVSPAENFEWYFFTMLKGKERKAKQ